MCQEMGFPVAAFAQQVVFTSHDSPVFLLRVRNVLLEMVYMSSTVPLETLQCFRISQVGFSQTLRSTLGYNFISITYTKVQC